MKPTGPLTHVIPLRTFALLALVASALTFLGSAGACAQARADRGQALAHELEGKLVAPCCWNESLDSHDSPLARELRAEIERRIAQNEAPSVIERDLIARYGVRIRAVPPALDEVSLVVVALLLLSAALLVFVARRWVTRSRARAADAARTLAAEHSPATPATEHARDAQLQAELSALDD